MQATLEITGSGEAPRSLPLQEGTTTIGRADTNVIVLNHANVSRRHIEIRIDGSSAQIADLNSANGTSVNEVKLSPQAWQPLNPGDRIQVGPFQLSFDMEPENDATVVINRNALPSPTPAPLLSSEPPPSPVYIPPEPVAPPPEPVAPIPVPEPVALAVRGSTCRTGTTSHARSRGPGSALGRETANTYHSAQRSVGQQLPPQAGGRSPYFCLRSLSR